MFKNPFCSQPCDAELLEFADSDPWVLCCAEDQGSCRYGMDFDMWWRLSGDNWTKAARQRFPNLTSARYEKFLRTFAEQNRGRGSFAVLNDVAIRRNLTPPVVLAGGAIAFRTSAAKGISTLHDH